MEATKNLSNSEVISYGGAGHWLMLERKEQVTKDVLSWLRKVRALPPREIPCCFESVSRPDFIPDARSGKL